MGVYTCHSVHVEGRGRLGGVGPLVPLYVGSKGRTRVPKLTWNIFPAFAFSISLVISACLSWKQHLRELKENLVWPSWSYNENFRGVRTATVSSLSYYSPFSCPPAG